jgi:hypothetical protein
VFKGFVDREVKTALPSDPELGDSASQLVHECACSVGADEDLFDLAQCVGFDGKGSVADSEDVEVGEMAFV